MTKYEEILLIVLDKLPDQNTKAMMLQSFIAAEGPLSEDAAARVRELLTKKEAPDAGPGPGREFD